ncbi:MAG: hypothetical protein ACLQGU_23045 [bacterium]
MIIGGFTLYSSSDSRAKAFIERLYPLRHIHGFMWGKPGAAVIICAIPSGKEQLPPACDMGVNPIMFYMMEEKGMNFLGSAKVSGNVPCVKCGIGDESEMSGIELIYGSATTVDSIGITTFEQQPDAIKAAKELGKKIRQEPTK